MICNVVWPIYRVPAMSKGKMPERIVSRKSFYAPQQSAQPVNSGQIVA
jgi:hypothetical protein